MDLIIIVAIICFLSGYLISFIPRIFKNEKVDIEDLPLEELDKKITEIEGKIFIFEALLKFLPASILTITISSLYVTDQDITYQNLHITSWLGIIILLLIILAIIFYFYRGHLYKRKYPTSRVINAYEEYEKVGLMDKKERNKKTEELLAKESEEDRLREKIKRKKEEALKENLKKIVIEFKEEGGDKSAIARKFENICTNLEIRGTKDSTIMGLIKECVFFMDLKDESAFKMMSEGVEKIVIWTNDKEHFFKVQANIKEKYVDLLKEIKSLSESERQFKLQGRIILDFIHVLANICDEEQFEIMLEIFHIQIKDISTVRVFTERVIESYFVHENYDFCENKIRLLMKEHNDIEFYTEMHKHISKYYGNPDGILQSDNYPHCFKKT